MRHAQKIYYKNTIDIDHIQYVNSDYYILMRVVLIIYSWSRTYVLEKAKSTPQPHLHCDYRSCQYSGGSDKSSNVQRDHMTAH